MTQLFDDWDAAYKGVPPPWDIGRPQPVFARLANEGRLSGRLLDAGCGTGEHTLLAAEHGASALGVDVSPSAIALARKKAVEKELTATFEVADMLESGLPDESFDVVVDSGVFHVFDDLDRERYVHELARVLRLGGRLLLMCFSDAQPGDWGPRRVRRDELETAFADGWHVERIEPAKFDINPMMDATSAAAWFAEMGRD